LFLKYCQSQNAQHTNWPCLLVRAAGAWLVHMLCHISRLLLLLLPQRLLLAAAAAAALFDLVPPPQCGALFPVGSQSGCQPASWVTHQRDKEGAGTGDMTVNWQLLAVCSVSTEGHTAMKAVGRVHCQSGTVTANHTGSQPDMVM
jgi:hypothetical protein